jgi:hypothetical protein
MLACASEEVAALWPVAHASAHRDPGPMGLAAGDRPAADVEVLAGALASVEYTLATRMHAASVAGALPITGPGGMLTARGWGSPWARRLARSGELASEHPRLAAVWAAGVVTSEHLDPIARHADRFTVPELAAVIDELLPLLGTLSPPAVTRFVEAALRLLHPPDDPEPGEMDAYQARDLSFAVTSDSVLLSGVLPRVEGELVIAAIDSIAERLRSTADQVPPGARRVDALVQLVNDAHAHDVLPTRGGLPVSLSVTLTTTQAGDAVWRTSRGHLLTASEERFAGCDAAVTPVLIGGELGCGDPEPAGTGALAGGAGPPAAHSAPAARIAALATTLFDTRIPLDVGRTSRTATGAQRRALATRDGGCVIPGCGVPAEACQIHHLQEWADGGSTDLANLVSLCWAHHRQVDLHMWTITPGRITAEGTAGPPAAGAPPGTAWPANNGAPFSVVRTPRTRWRL